MSDKEPKRIWVEHARELVDVMDSLKNVQKLLENNTKSDLEYPSLERVPVEIYGTDTGWTLVYVDDAWWIELKED